MSSFSMTNSGASRRARFIYSPSIPVFRFLLFHFLYLKHVNRIHIRTAKNRRSFFLPHAVQMLPVKIAEKISPVPGESYRYIVIRNLKILIFCFVISTYHMLIRFALHDACDNTDSAPFERSSSVSRLISLRVRVLYPNIGDRFAAHPIVKHTIVSHNGINHRKNSGSFIFCLIT